MPPERGVAEGRVEREHDDQPRAKDDDDAGERDQYEVRAPLVRMPQARAARVAFHACSVVVNRLVALSG